MSQEFITIAILAKDKAHTLPSYLKCIEAQKWPKNQTYIYIRTNNNNDNTVEILRNWVEKVKDQYPEIYFDPSDTTEQVQKYQQHEWNCERFKVLGKIRQESIIWAFQHNSHYFVIDCDNFIKPNTLEALFNVNLPIVAPLLRSHNTVYSNLHAAIDANGYYIDCPLYYQLVNQEIKGLVEVPVVHCTYLVRHSYIPYLTYDDESCRYEYVIFSDSARRNKVPQYFDTREVYGFCTQANDVASLLSEDSIVQFLHGIGIGIN
jgi:hypothetical protein